ncbi:oligosaccharide flippase family protein [Marinivivus vitaminiproducens]|uniref:oligosaccharide flippase family protein n=1 Tax=Marinivivus vitaminiproducens TaxID=3035935 RepID=UPI00279875A1|nr:oligosaccharide flippase family protein [Geminicoccaceae bacterium SCSIO 64248]
MIRRALFLSFGERYVGIALRLIQLTVLARLLTPEEFGIFVTAASIVLLLDLIADFGMSSYLIQARTVSRRRRSTAFGITLTASLLCACFVVIVAGSLPDSLIDPRLREVLYVLAAGLPLTGIAVPIIALLQRDMRFGALWLVGTARAVVLTFVGIGLAFYGAGPMSLAWASLAERVVFLATALHFSREVGWVWPRLDNWRSVARFGGLQTVANSLKQAADAVTMVVTSKSLGFGSTGLLSRADRITGMFDQTVMQAIQPVILPALAALRRADQELRGFYLRTVALISVVSWPFFAFVFLFAPDLVHLLLGSQWDAVVPVARVLCLAGIFLPFVNMLLKFYTAVGQVDVFVRCSMIVQVTQLCLIIPASLISLEAVALALACETFLRYLITVGALKTRLGFSHHDVFVAVIPSLLVTLSTVVTATIAHELLKSVELPVVIELALGGFGAGIGWFASLFATGHPLADEIRALGHRAFGPGRKHAHGG